MSEITNKFRIEDLANPVLTDIQKGALAYATANPVPMSAEAVLETARTQTGLSDFGDDDFRERLNMWVQATNNDTELSEVGRAGIFAQMVRNGVNRLHLEDAIRRHPESMDIDIDRPILIAGLPRSGTTYTLQLMSYDPRLRSLPHWEGIRPVPEPYIVDGKDTRHDLCAQEWEQIDTILPYVKNIHEFTPDHITEDIELQNIAFGGYHIEWLAHVPEWRDYQFSHDPTPVYRYVRRAMQLLSWYKGPNRWVSKCPQHMEQLLPLNAAFPNAFTVINHRDPVASIQSAITGVAYSARITRTRVDMKQIAEYWIDRYEHLLRNCVRDRDQLDPKDSYDLYFHELMADPFGQLEKIYQGAGVPFDDETRAAFQNAVEHNKRGKHGQLVYNLREDFGLEPEAIRERFGFYFDRFPVRIEVK